MINEKQLILKIENYLENYKVFNQFHSKKSIIFSLNKG